MMLTLPSHDPKTLAALARRIRLHVLRMTSAGGSSHVGSVFSMADIMAALCCELYSMSIRLIPVRLNAIGSFLARGTRELAFYAALAERGFIPVSPARHTLPRCVEAQRSCFPQGRARRGDLDRLTRAWAVRRGGHGLRSQTDEKSHRVFCVLSDGECDEGSVWEAALFAAHHKLSRPVAIIDYNKIQSLATIEQTIRLEPFAEKWRAFGWRVSEVDGHDLAALVATLEQPDAHSPTCVIAHTTKGKGVSFMENSVLWHYRTARGEEFESALRELSDPGNS